jgi:hypothetical protein
MYRVELKVVVIVCVLKRFCRFLMYRVELKDLSDFVYAFKLSFKVPNVPCGVESSVALSPTPCPALHLFLMYRVELKVLVCHILNNCPFWFLMYRVELKVSILHSRTLLAEGFLMYRVELKVPEKYLKLALNGGS